MSALLGALAGVCLLMGGIERQHDRRLSNWYLLMAGTCIGVGLGLDYGLL